MSTTKSTKAPRRPAPAMHPAAKPRTPDAAPVEAHDTDARRQASAAQTEAGSVAAPLAPTASRPSQSTPTDRNATTSRVEPVSPASRRVARAILSTLAPDAAACVLAALAGLASAIINAASTLRCATGEGARRAASTMLDAAATDGFEGLRDADGNDTSTAAYAVCAAWCFATPLDFVASFWVDSTARELVAAHARGMLAEADVMRREVSQNDPSATVRYVEGLPFPAVRLADGSTLVNPAAVRPLARGGEELPEGVARLDAGGFSWRRGVEAEGLESERSADAPAAARVLRVEAPPFASTSKGLAGSVGRVLYAAPSNVEGFTDVASGLAGLVAGSLDANDAAGLVAGLAKIADHYAAKSAESAEARDARIYLREAAEALDAARLAARSTLDALDGASEDTHAHAVTVAAA